MDHDVIVAGELNVDLLLNEIAEFPVIGKEILADSMNLVLGSSSAIFASNLSSLGTSVAFTGNVGNDDFGNFCIECLKAKNVDTRFINMDSGNGTGMTVIMNFGEDRAMLTYQGAMKTFSIEHIDEKCLRSARHLHFSSFFLQPGIAPDIPTLFKRAKELGVTVSFDPQWDPNEKWDINLKELLPYVDVFLPNKKEFIALTGSEDWQKGLHDLRDFSNIIVVKDGNNGSYVSVKGEVTHCEPFLNTSVIDAIGAGDSFNAGFIHKFVKKAPIPECQRFANLTGAISTTAAGGTGAFSNIDSIKELAAKRFNYNDF